MAERNGNLWKIIAVLVTLGIVGLTTMNALGVFQGEIKKDVAHNHEAIMEVKIDVDLLEDGLDEVTYYSIGDAKDTQILTERIDNQGKLLNERIDALREDVSDFAIEQRSVNKEILDRLPPR